MIPRIVGLLLLVLLVSVPPAAAAGGHYLPQTGDGFHYLQTVQLAGGTGNYTGYSENTSISGSVGVTAVLPNGTDSASYQSLTRWSNSTGSLSSWNSAGGFTFSAVNFHYVQGTDNQTGYTNPFVWFYMNNSLATGAGFYLLNTGMTVTSRDHTFEYSIGFGGTEAVTTISADGTGTFHRNDAYGVFTATYDWKAFFDPATGYIVGYDYTEQDTDGAGDGFTLADSLAVNSTTYPLTMTSAFTPGLSLPPLITVVTVVLGVVALVAVVVVVAWLLSRSRRRRLPQHATPGAIGFGLPPVPPPTGVPPPIHLTPSQQPIPQVVLRETVKVNCRYCGTLIDTTDTVCPNCGAPRT